MLGSSPCSSIVSSLKVREHACQQLLIVARHVAALSLQSLGPAGRLSLVRISEQSGQAVATSSSSTLIESLVCDERFPKFFLSLLSSHLRIKVDSGFLCSALTSMILAKLFDSKGDTAFSKASLPLCELVLSTCLKWCQIYLANPECPCFTRLDWSDMNIVTNFVSSILTKRLCRVRLEDIEQISLSLIEAVLRSLSMDDGNVSAVASRLKVLKVHGHGHGYGSRAEVVGGVIVDVPLPLRYPSAIADINVALFSEPLRFLPKDLYKGHSSLVVEDFSILDRVQEQQMEEFCNVCITRNVGLVASQQVIHPMLQTRLLAKNVMCVERLSIRHIKLVAQLCGGDLLSSSNAVSIRQAKLGHLTSLQIIQRGSKRFVHLDNASMGFCTVLLCCEDENVAEELEGSVVSAVKLLVHALEAPFLLAGAGATELFLAHHLRSKASEWQKIEKERESVEHVANSGFVELVEEFADCLERIATALVTPMSHIDALLALKQANQLHDLKAKRRGIFGWDVDLQRISCVLGTNEDNLSTSKPVLDSLNAKLFAIESSVEMLLTLLRIDPIL